MGVISSKGSIAVLDKLTASSFCRRRFAVILVRLKMAESIKEAATFIEQGRTLSSTIALLTSRRCPHRTRGHPGPSCAYHSVRLLPLYCIVEMLFICLRKFEDFVTWVDTSKIKRQILKYNDRLDDFDIM